MNVVVIEVGVRLGGIASCDWRNRLREISDNRDGAHRFYISVWRDWVSENIERMIYSKDKIWRGYLCVA